MYVEFEKGEKYSNSIADISDNHEAFDSAGWVLEKDDYIVDIDSVEKDVLKELISYFDIKTQIVWTERGVHFYFKKPEDFRRGANAVSPLGFKFEIKHQANTKAITIKKDGELREIENEGKREEVPFIFKSTRKKFDVLYGLDDGEGRNNALYKLRANISTRRDWRRMLLFVNKYIFAVPLSEDEMENLTRDMVFDTKSASAYEVAGMLMEEMSFIKYGQTAYFKVDGEYLSGDDELRRLVFSKVGDQTTNYIDEIVKQMKYRGRMIPLDTVFKVKFKNGYLMNGKFYELKTDDFSPYNIDIDYKADCKPVKIVDDYINHLTGDCKDYRNFLLEILGHILIVDKEFKRMLAKFFIFVGDGGNGKGTLLQIIKKIVGIRNATAMNIKQLSDENHLANFKGKLVNLGDDIQNMAINDKDMKALKNISTCDFMSVREIYQRPETIELTGTLIFTSNHILKSWEKGNSYQRRVMWLPMYSEVKKKDPKFITNLTTKEALEYWIKLIVEGYIRLYEQGVFTDVSIVNEFNDNYHNLNNPVLDYMVDKTIDDFRGKPVKVVQEDFKAWCEDNDENYSRNMLIEEIKKRYKLSSKGVKYNGKNTKCYCG